MWEVVAVAQAAVQALAHKEQAAWYEQSMATRGDRERAMFNLLGDQPRKRLQCNCRNCGAPPENAAVCSYCKT